MNEIFITKEAYQRLKYFIEECPTEISGIGKVREIRSEVEIEEEDDDDGDLGVSRFWDKEQKSVLLEETLQLEIYSIEVLKQKVTSAHSTIDESALAKFLHGKMKSGEAVEDYKVWWHSHADFASFFSATDKQTIDESNTFPYLVSVVMNKDKDIKCRLDIYNPLRLNFPLELIVRDEENEDIKKQCQKEIKSNVTEKVGYLGGGDSHGGDYNGGGYHGKGYDWRDWEKNNKRKKKIWKI